MTDKNRLNEIKPFEIYGTGFFVSKDGKLITNRHVAEPWKEDVEGSQSWNFFILYKRSDK